MMKRAKAATGKVQNGGEHLSLSDRFRLLMSVFFVLLGLVIVVQGLRLGAPWDYTVVGLLMAGLGAYRLRLAWTLWTRGEPAAEERE